MKDSSISQVALKPSLVDVPVRINIWTRPDCQRKQFDVLRKARPSILFLKSDGGRNKREWELIRLNRKMFDEEIDWDCTVYKMYETKNLGLYQSGAKMSNFIWKHVDRCIFLEDDDIPSISFFRFCAELLEKYKDDYRINAIGGNNPLGTFGNPESDYFFSKVVSISGMALWKRSVINRGIDLVQIPSYYRRNIILLAKEDRLGEARHLRRVFTEGKDGNHVAAGEFFNVFNRYAENQLYIIPSKNLVSNIGYGEDATHSGKYEEMPRVVKKYFFGMKNYEYTFPLRHPRYMVPDIVYAKKFYYILGIGHPILTFVRNIEKIFLAIRHGNWERVISGLKKRIHPNIEY